MLSRVLTIFAQIIMFALALVNADEPSGLVYAVVFVGLILDRGINNAD